MKITPVLMAGGSGTRLWPVSRKSFPKQFAALIDPRRFKGGKLKLHPLDAAAIVTSEELGIQAPEITWGLMVSQGRQYLTTAWWLSFWPGLAIILTTLSLNLLSNWLRIALDPTQRWRLEMKETKA